LGTIELSRVDYLCREKVLAMNARLFLLVLVTGLFMTAWDGDQDAMQAAIARRAIQPTTAIARKDDRRPARYTMLHPRQSLTAIDAHPQSEQIPRPAGISSGNYQAVSQSGQTVRMTVVETADSHVSHRDFYTADATDGSRWYWIRIE
jgi:hypothetical protein